MSYIIAGRKVAAEYLTLATLGTIGGVVALSTAGGSKSKAKPTNEQPLSASGSKDEEDFIKNFLAEAEKEESKGAKH